MLVLPIKKKWFDLILKGEKKEEYRECSDYYLKRFNNLFDSIETDKKEIMFRNGYNSNSPYFVAICSWHIGTGIKEWGAEESKEYNCLTIHSILKSGNLK